MRRAEATLLQGIQVGSVFEEQKVFDVIVQGVPETRRSVADVRNLLIDTPGRRPRAPRRGRRRSRRADAAIIEREAVSRRIDVEAEVSGRRLGAVASDVEARLADVSFPLEYHARGAHRTHGPGDRRRHACSPSRIGCAIADFLLFRRRSEAGAWRRWPS